MEYTEIKALPRLHVGTGWITLEVIDEVNVLPTFKGYAPVLPVRVEPSGLPYILYISAKSICETLEQLRSNNGGYFTGLRLALRKESDEQFAKYVVECRS